MWLGEENTNNGILIKLFADKILVRTSSDFFEKIIIAENKIFGKFLVFKEKENWTLQVTEKWDFYSEMLVHVPMVAHDNPKKVLIIGGGDGSTLCQVLKHNIDKIVLVDIDRKVLEIGKNIMANNCFSDTRVFVYCEDAYKFVNEHNEKFDVIIGDHSDPYPDLPAKTLINDDFYRRLRDLLEEDGIISLQAGSPIFQIEIMKKYIMVYRENLKELVFIVLPF